MTPMGAAVETKGVGGSDEKPRKQLEESPVRQTEGRLVGAQRKDRDVGFGGSGAQIASVKATSAAVHTCQHSYCYQSSQRLHHYSFPVRGNNMILVGSLCYYGMLWPKRSRMSDWQFFPLTETISPASSSVTFSPSRGLTELKSNWDSVL